MLESLASQMETKDLPDRHSASFLDDTLPVLERGEKKQDGMT